VFEEQALAATYIGSNVLSFALGARWFRRCTPTLRPLKRWGLFLALQLVLFGLYWAAIAPGLRPFSSPDPTVLSSLPGVALICLIPCILWLSPALTACLVTRRGASEP
jgi:hypothetical protein